MSVSASGLGSGIDIRGLVDDLLRAEGETKSLKYDTDEADILAKITGFGTLKSSLSDFQSKLTNLKDITRFQQRTASSADETIFTATADSTSTSGVYNVEVTQLAENHKIKSQVFSNKDEIVGTGTLVFTIGSTTHSINITSADQTVEGIKDRINETSSDTGISATLVTSDAGTQIVFTADEGGAANIFTVSVTDDLDADNADDAGLSQLDQAYSTIQATGLDSIVKIDGATVTSDTNVIEDAIDGVTLTLLATNIADEKKVTIGLDIVAADVAVKEFVSGYNAVFDAINSLSQYNGEDSEVQGILIGDSTLRSLEIQIRREINTFVNKTGVGFSSIAQLGITSNDTTGKLEIKSSKLTAALTENFDAVGELFANTTDGIAKRMDSMLENYLKSGGILDSKTGGLNDSIDIINEKRIDLERSLQQMESRLLSQFIAMDSIVASLQSTGSFLTQQLDSLAEPLAYKK
jgi:flagellar hook-associated protein 2